MEVTESHVFLGYKPLIIGISLLTNSLEHQALKDESNICLSFGKKSFNRDKTWRGFLTDRTALARLVLRKIGEKVLHERVHSLF